MRDSRQVSKLAHAKSIAYLNGIRIIRRFASRNSKVTEMFGRYGSMNNTVRSAFALATLSNGFE